MGFLTKEEKEMVPIYGTSPIEELTRDFVFPNNTPREVKILYFEHLHLHPELQRYPDDRPFFFGTYSVLLGDENIEPYYKAALTIYGHGSMIPRRNALINSFVNFLLEREIQFAERVPARYRWELNN
ncbi:hypothetical protein ACFL0V_04310 [Nanoarchaeota archaeon]